MTEARVIEVSEIKGHAGFRAFQAFHTLLLGLKMLPAYLHETYEEFYEQGFKDKSDEEKAKFLREALLFVKLEEDEIESLVSFAKDINGVPYGKSNIKNLKPDELSEILVAVLSEIGRIKITLVTSDEKKNCHVGG